MDKTIKTVSQRVMCLLVLAESLLFIPGVLHGSSIAKHHVEFGHWNVL